MDGLDKPGRQSLKLAGIERQAQPFKQENRYESPNIPLRRSISIEDLSFKRFVLNFVNYFATLYAYIPMRIEYPFYSAGIFTEIVFD